MASNFQGFLLIVIVASACAESKQKRAVEAPSLVRTFSQLPEAASLSEQPWADSYWPDYQGGISYRWNEENGVSESARRAYALNYDVTRKDLSRLSPAEKYDLLRARYDHPTTVSERSRTQVLRTIKSSGSFDASFKIPKWMGLCHAWASAALNFEEPQPVTLTNPDGLKIPFGSSDIKALLVYFLDQTLASNRTSMLGQRCDSSRGDCKDLDAGAFHIVLTNQIGLMKEGLIADITSGEEVWNQPVYAYRSKIVSESSDVSAEASPGTVKELTLLTTIYFGMEAMQQWTPAPVKSDQRNYSYRIELDAEGQVIGGTWLSQDRPDFIWKQVIPSFNAAFETIQRIYESSLQPALSNSN